MGKNVKRAEEKNNRYILRMHNSVDGTCLPALIYTFSLMLVHMRRQKCDNQETNSYKIESISLFVLSVSLCTFWIYGYIGSMRRNLVSRSRHQYPTDIVFNGFCFFFMMKSKTSRILDSSGNYDVCIFMNLVLAFALCTFVLVSPILLCFNLI